ncbi:transglycosylase domain-containing protein [Nocardioides lijunqiniae]|uniref:transglycosylase domain-containing protein n=1 Tax=Nocardioides lijunqiniae TaxID=2760832 RepID=UPI0030B8159C
MTKVRKGKGKKTPLTPRQRVKKAAKWLLIVGLVGALVAVGTFVFLYNTIEVPDANEDFQTETSFVYYDGGKSELGSYAVQDRESIPLEEIPEDLQNAVIAAENRTFWSDPGIDPKGILRASFSNASGNSTQGASTITQQYVKILYLTQERSLTRKTKEAILSLKIRRQMTKSEILAGYLNTIYFGRGAYGVQAAARAYFDKPAKALNLRQSAVLASVLNNPTRLDPANGEAARETLLGRYQFVLDGMAEMDDTYDEPSAAARERLPKFPKIKARSAYGDQKGHMLTLVRNELNRLGFDDEQIDGKGLRITTTFTEKAMRAAKEGVVEARPEGFKDKQLHVGVASVEPGTGAVRGFYGGQDYLQSQLNWAVAGGQAGSILKPFAVAAGLKAGFSLKDTFEGNSPIEIGDTEFENQGNESFGPVSLLRATEGSVNTAFIDLTDSIPDGPEKVIEMANALGIPPEKPRGKNPKGIPTRTPGLEPNVGVALGSATVSPINMANAYATIANGGEAAAPYVVQKVVAKDGEVLYSHKNTTKRVLDKDIAADVSYALEQVVDAPGGTGADAQALGRPAGGKTGTSTNDKGDVVSSWFTGFTPQLATSVVYVRGKGAEPLDGWLPSFYGGDYPTATWTAVMERALEGTEVLELADPVFVDGEAPDDGHSPAPPPPPKPTKKPTKKPDDKPSDKPTDKPTPKPTPTPTPTPTPVPTPTPTPTPTGPELPTGPPETTPAGGATPRPRAYRESYRFW